MYENIKFLIVNYEECKDIVEGYDVKPELSIFICDSMKNIS